MEITQKNVERILRGYGLGMDAGLNEHWLSYGFETETEKPAISIEEAYLLKPSNIRAVKTQDEEVPVFPCRTLNLHDLSDLDIRAVLARLYGNISYLEYTRFCERNELPRMTFEQWTLLERQLTATAKDSSVPKRKKDRAVSNV